MARWSIGWNMSATSNTGNDFVGKVMETEVILLA